MRTKSDTIQKYFLQISTLVCFVIFATASTLFWTPTYAKSLGSELEAIQNKKEKTQQLKNIKENQKAIISQQIRNIDREAESIENKIQDTKETIKKTEVAIDRTRKGIVQHKKAIMSQRTVLGQLIRLQYERGTQTALAHILNKGRLVQSTDYTAQTQGKIHTTISRIEQLKGRLEDDQVKLEEEKEGVVDAKKKLEQRTDYLESTRSYKSYLSAQTQSDIRKYQKKISEIEKEEISIRREIEQIELAKLDNVSLGDLPSKKDADFKYPVDPVRITQGYGRTGFSATAYKSGRHNGVDFGGGGSVRSAADGRVVAVGNMGRYGYGRWAAVNHGNGLVTFYGHMSRVKVKSGDKIDQGDKIGKMGTTGYSTGVHLHFTVFAASSFEIVNSSRVNGLKVPIGASINPMIYL